MKCKLVQLDERSPWVFLSFFCVENWRSYDDFPHIFQNSGKMQHATDMLHTPAPAGSRDLSNGTSISPIGRSTAEKSPMDKQTIKQAIFLAIIMVHAFASQGFACFAFASPASPEASWTNKQTNNRPNWKRLSEPKGTPNSSTWCQR